MPPARARPALGRRAPRCRRLLGLAWLAAGCALSAALGFAGAGARGRAAPRGRRLALRAEASAGSEAEIREEVNKLRAREIKRELEALGVNAADAFEKDELAERLVRARLSGAGPAAGEAPPEAAAAEAAAAEASTADTSAASSASEVSVSADVLERCRAMRVTQLRTELGSRGILWADALEKEELVQRLAQVMAQEASFSGSGRLRPGAVVEITGAELEQELSDHSTPLLLDVFATWCGPCQMMYPHLEAAARHFGPRVRVAKLDSDKEPQMASRLRVGGLPTIILFNQQGAEVKRQEGALMEQQLVGLVESAGL